MTEIITISTMTNMCRFLSLKHSLLNRSWRSNNKYYAFQQFSHAKTYIWQQFLYGSDSSSLTLREEYRLRVFVNRVLRIIFGPKRDEMI
jgi:hypothetical protein